MDKQEWNSIYKQIVREFGFDTAEDERSSLILSHLLTAKGSNESMRDKLRSVINGHEVLVCGKAPTLIHDIQTGKIKAHETIIAADGATSTLLSQGVIPHVIVSDLDGRIKDLQLANVMCAIMVVHAHGDNINAIESVVPTLSKVIGTTQTRPLSNVFNVGGFTDGDRAVFLAIRCGARAIHAIGFDFSDRNVSATKLKKLQWAQRLLRDTDVNFK
jgi:uncharacterized Rossmann fold enzyme